MAYEAGQRPNALTPLASGWHFLGAELRRWREHRNLSAGQLARLVFVSADLVAKVEKAHRRAGADLIGACDTVLNTDGALGRLLEFVRHNETPEPAPLPTAPPPPEVLIRVTAEVVVPDAPDRRSARSSVESGGARIYRFPTDAGHR